VSFSRLLLSCALCFSIGSGSKSGTASCLYIDSWPLWTPTTPRGPCILKVMSINNSVAPGRASLAWYHIRGQSSQRRYTLTASAKKKTDTFHLDRRAAIAATELHRCRSPPPPTIRAFRRARRAAAAAFSTTRRRRRRRRRRQQRKTAARGRAIGGLPARRSGSFMLVNRAAGGTAARRGRGFLSSHQSTVPQHLTHVRPRDLPPLSHDGGEHQNSPAPPKEARKQLSATGSHHRNAFTEVVGWLRRGVGAMQIRHVNDWISHRGVGEEFLSTRRAHDLSRV